MYCLDWVIARKLWAEIYNNKKFKTHVGSCERGKGVREYNFKKSDTKMLFQFNIILKTNINLKSIRIYFIC